MDKNKKKKKAMSDAKKKQAIDTKGLTPEQKDKLKADNEKQKKADKKAKTKKLSEDFKKLSDAEKKAIKDKYIEFQYIDELTDEILKDILDNAIYSDPGKNNLVTMIDDDDNLFTYSNNQYLHETRKVEYGKHLQNYRKKEGITEIEQQLIDFNSKTCDLKKFKEYVKKKNEINKKLFADYAIEKFRQYKWYAYLNKKRAEDNLLNKIEEKYAKDDKKLNIIMGDWGAKGNQMKGFVSTPRVGMLRLLARRFNVYLIDEFRTSKVHYETETFCDNLYNYSTHYDNKSKKVHSVLTFKMQNNRQGCINRDVNAVYNMRKLVKYWIAHKGRPQIYTRTIVDTPKSSTINKADATFTHSAAIPTNKSSNSPRLVKTVNTNQKSEIKVLPENKPRQNIKQQSVKPLKEPVIKAKQKPLNSQNKNKSVKSTKNNRGNGRISK